MNLPDLVAALRAPGTPAELHSEQSTVASMLAAHAGISGAVVVPLASRRRPALIAAGSTVGALALAVLVGGTAAAYSGALPPGLQGLAHDLIGAPAASTSTSVALDATTSAASTSESTQGPDASTDSPALYGLCVAFGGLASDAPQTGSVAYQSLASAAAEAGSSIKDYCDPVLAAKASDKPTNTHKPTAKPSNSHKPTARPSNTNKPTATPGISNKPSAPAGR